MRPTARRRLQKVTVTSPAVAAGILREYLAQAGSCNKATGRKKSASAVEVANWYQSSHGDELVVGWFGRSLNQAISDGMPIAKTLTKINGKAINLYHRA